MELSWGLPTMAGHGFGIQRLPLHPHGDFSARPTALPAFPFLLLPVSFSKLCYSSQSSLLPQGGRSTPVTPSKHRSDEVQAATRLSWSD